MPSTELLAELVRRKHQVLVQLRDVGRRQMELVQGGDTGELLKLLAAKQYLIAGLQQTEKELAPFHNDDPELRVWPVPADRTRCAEQADECAELIAEIVTLEKESAEKMAARRNRVAEQLQQVNSAGQVRSAYEVQRGHTTPSPTLRPSRAADRVDISTHT